MLTFTSKVSCIFKLTLLVLLLTVPSVQTIGQLSASEEVFSNKIEFSTTDFSRTLSGARTNFSSVTTFHRSVYFVYCDNNRRPIVGKISPSGEVQTTYLDKEETSPYIVQDDNHHVFSIGTDRMGYIHVVGDNHANFFETDPDLLPLKFQGAPYMHWVSESPQSIDSFEFIGLTEERRIPGYAFSYISFHTDMNGMLFAQYRSRIHQVDLPAGSNGWCMAKYDEITKTWNALGGIPEPTNAKGIYPAVLWEQSGYLDKLDPSKSFYQAFMSDINFDFNNRMHIAATINADSTFDNETHVIYAYSDDSGESFKKPGDVSIAKLPIRPREGPQQGSIVDSVGNNTFDGIYTSASVVFDINGVPAVSFLTLEDRVEINADDHDHFRYWIPTQRTWSDLQLSPQMSQAGSEHFLDCNGIINFAGSRTWNAQMYRTTAFNKEGYNAFALPNESNTVTAGGVDERGIREENVVRWMVENDESLMIVSSKFEPVRLSPLTNNWEQNQLGKVSGGQVGEYNNVLQILSSGTGLLADGSLDMQFVNKTLEGDGGIQVRIINVDYHNGAFGGLMLSADTNGTGNFYMATIDYEGIKASSNTGDGGSLHFESAEMNEPSEWLRLVRSGSYVNAYQSDNGSDWFLFDSLQIDLPNTMTVGLISGSGGVWSGTTRADKLQSFKDTYPLSVSEPKLTTEMKIYPNPSSSLISVEFLFTIDQIDELLIFDIQGKRINSCTKKQTGINTIEIDISTLKMGIYYVGVPGEIWSKFIKTNR